MTKTSIYVEGAGMLGCALMRELSERALVDFKWYDRDDVVKAWHASTGQIYPSYNPNEDNDYQLWVNEYYGRYRVWMEEADLWYSSKGHPNKIKAKPLKESDGGALRLSPYKSYHLNVQQFVTDHRKMFAHKRTVRPLESGEYDIKITAHGFGDTLSRYIWGWSALVSIVADLPNLGLRPCIYMPEGIGRISYLYPVPNRDGDWYFSTYPNMVVQREPNELNALKYARNGADRVAAITKGEVQITHLHSVKQGWRPKGDHTIKQAIALNSAPSLGTSGVKSALTWAKLMTEKVEADLCG